MPNPFVPPPTGKRIDTDQVDEYGNVIVRSSYLLQEIQQADGSMLEVVRAASLQTSDGFEWNPALARGDKPIHVGVCPACRKPRLFGKTPHGLVTLANAKHCGDCGTLCCPKHRKRKHGRWRCIRCHRRYVRKCWINWIFYK